MLKSIINNWQTSAAGAFLLLTAFFPGIAQALGMTPPPLSLAIPAGVGLLLGQDASKLKGTLLKGLGGGAVILLLALALLVGGCSTAQKAQISTDMAAVKADTQKALKLIIPKAKTALDGIQADYPFWCAVLQGTLQVAGVKITQAQMDAALPFIAAADDALTPLGQAVNNEPVQVVDVQKAITAAVVAVPALRDRALENPAVAAIYQKWQTGQTNLPAPAVAPATPAAPAVPTPAPVPAAPAT